jgi:O-antigen ligase
VHSIWFGVLAELGYPGLVLFVALIGLSFWSCWRVSFAVKRDPQRQDLRIYANALMASLAAYAVGGTFLPFQYNEMFWHIMALGISLTFLAQEQPSQVVATVPVLAPRMQPAVLGTLRGALPK